MIGDCDQCQKSTSLTCFPTTSPAVNPLTMIHLRQHSSIINWTTIDNKIQNVSCEMDLNDAEDVLVEKVRVLKYHLHVQWEQYKRYNEIKNGLKESEMLAHVDFAENYKN